MCVYRGMHFLFASLFDHHATRYDVLNDRPVVRNRYTHDNLEEVLLPINIGVRKQQIYYYCNKKISILLLLLLYLR